jgi:hypothetical protein
MTKAQKTARKAAATRKARNALIKKYGAETYDAIKMIKQGKTNDEIYWNAWIPRRSIAAYRACFTRGIYDHILKDCNF